MSAAEHTCLLGRTTVISREVFNERIIVLSSGEWLHACLGVLQGAIVARSQRVSQRNTDTRGKRLEKAKVGDLAEALLLAIITVPMP